MSSSFLVSCANVPHVGAAGAVGTGSEVAWLLSNGLTAGR